MFVFPFYTSTILGKSSNVVNALFYDYSSVRMKEYEAFEIAGTSPKLTMYDTSYSGWMVMENDITDINNTFLITDAQYCKNSNRIIVAGTTAASSNSARLFVIDSVTFDIIQDIIVPTSANSGDNVGVRFSISNQEDKIAIATGNKIILYSLDTYEEISRFQFTPYGSSLVRPRNIQFINDDANILIAANNSQLLPNEQGIFRCLDTNTFEDVHIIGDNFLDNPQTIVTFGFNKQMNMLVVVKTIATEGIKIYNASGGVYDLLPVGIPNQTNATVVEFSPDNRFMVTGAAQTLSIYDTKTWKKLANPSILPTNNITSISFRQDSQEMSVTYGTTTRIYSTVDWLSWLLNSSSTGGKREVEFKDTIDYVNYGVEAIKTSIVLNDVFDEEAQFAIWARSSSFNVFNSKRAEWNSTGSYGNSGNVVGGAMAWNPETNVYIVPNGQYNLGKIAADGTTLGNLSFITLPQPNYDITTSIKFNADFSEIYVQRGTTVYVFDYETFSITRQMTGIPNGQPLTFINDYSYFATVPRIYSLDGTLIATLSGNRLSPTSNYSVTVSSGVLDVYSLDENFVETLHSIQPSVKPSGTIFGSMFSYDGKYFAVTQSASPTNVIVYNTDTWEVAASAFIAGGNLGTPMFYPSNNRIFIYQAPTTSGAQTIGRVFDINNNYIRSFNLLTNTGTYPYTQSELITPIPARESFVEFTDIQKVQSNVDNPKVETFANSIYSASTATNFVVDKPLGTEENDLLVMILSCGSVDNLATIPAGWTELVNITSGVAAVNQQRTYIYTKIATNTEPSTYTVTLSAARRGVISCIRFSNAAIDIHDTSTNRTSPSINVSDFGSLVIHGTAQRGADNGQAMVYTYPSEDIGILQASTSAGASTGHAVSYNTPDNIGISPSATFTVTNNNSGNHAVGFSIVIKPI